MKAEERKREFEQCMLNFADNIWDEGFCHYNYDKGEKQLEFIWQWIGQNFISRKELTAKIKEMKEEATNFQVIGVLDKIIKMIEE